MGGTGEDRSGTSKVLAPVGAYAADGQGVVSGASSRQHRAAVWKGVLGGGQGFSWLDSLIRSVFSLLSLLMPWRKDSRNRFRVMSSSRLGRVDPVGEDQVGFPAIHLRANAER